MRKCTATHCRRNSLKQADNRGIKQAANSNLVMDRVADNRWINKGVASVFFAICKGEYHKNLAHLCFREFWYMRRGLSGALETFQTFG